MEIIDNIDIAKIAKVVDEAIKKTKTPNLTEEIHRAAVRLSLQAYYDSPLFEEFLQLPEHVCSSIVLAAASQLRKKAMRHEITKDEYLAEKRILQTLCAFLPPAHVDSTFKKQVLPYMDGAGYIQLYRGICEEELAELRAGNIDALGIWWTTIIETAVEFGLSNQIIHGEPGFVISWRVLIGYLKSVTAVHPGEVRLSPRQVWDSGKCGKIEVLTLTQIKAIKQINKSQ